MNLRQQFHQRDRTFSKHTKAILDALVDVTNGASEFIKSLPDSFYKHGTVVWEDVSLVKDYIMLVGVLRYENGTTFMFKNEMIEITEANKEYWQRVMRVGVPLDIIESGTKEDIIQFLQSVYDAELNEVNELIKEIEEEFYSSDDESKEEEEFDLDQLSEEQRKQLQMFRGNGGIS